MGMSNYYKRAIGVPRDPALDPPVVMVDTPPVIEKVEPTTVLADIFKPKVVEKKASKPKKEVAKAVKPKVEKEKVWPEKPKKSPLSLPKKATKAKK